MRLVIRLLGTEVFAVETGPEAAAEDGAELAGGTTSSYPVGFTPAYGDQRWETPLKDD
jgi:hypothetical protein